jgi:cytochrome c oxidase subunit 2
MLKQIIKMRLIGCASIVALGGIWVIRAQSPDTDANRSAKVIEVSAKKYEFTPGEIHVKKGTRVELRVHSVDETHGIKLDLYPQGSRDKSTPGLLFDKPGDNGKVEKNQDQILDFVAQQPGAYEFKCAKICGMHHGSMKGSLIVEE